ncbi:metallophosphoesterase [Gordonia sp. (in: high G+C Gram-positive bacteria)]|uniref:metallophosphoesterase family protein n=1 Tax=Gordonia sp. (in: high G+C Gram-positive bacteria) TaxID=84139 RepID=UPI0016AABAD2|nr:metallophosphoesterase [Gordonia sp. (in: high G+C Gram-positive bacteria)]NLG45453.1 metallophosphoesterase [Gordonia sp. (in: high G+C Gram-positive bacteria)]
MFVVAQISDLHVNGTAEHRKRVDAVMDYLNGRCGGPRNIDALLVTGDIADEGLPEEYREAVDALATDIPVLWTLGNHDDRTAYNSVIREASCSEPVNSALRLDGLLVLTLDSSIPGRSDGYLSRGTLDWASAQIAEAGSDTPVLVAFHHPAVTIGIPFIDDRCQLDPALLAEFVEAHPNIVGCVSGHAHTPAVTTFAGRPHVVAPGVSSTLNLPFEGDDVVNTVQRPGVAFHLIDDDRRLTTHFRGIPS